VNVNRTGTGPLGQAFSVDLASLSDAERALFGALPPVVLLAHQWDHLARTVTRMSERIAELEEDREVQARINTEAISKLMQALSDCRKEQLKP
jgi:hypothetical protein